MEAIRVGQVSSINYKEGMIKILYKDRDNAVTDELPVISFNDEYKMPQVGDYVSAYIWAGLRRSFQN